MAKYKILISSTICMVDKYCETVNLVNKMFDMNPIHKKADYPFEIDIEIDDKKNTEEEISSYLLQKANDIVELIKTKKSNQLWFENVKLVSISKEYI